MSYKVYRYLHYIKVPTWETCDRLHETGYGDETEFVWMNAREEDTGAPVDTVQKRPPWEADPRIDGRQAWHWCNDVQWQHSLEDWDSIRPAPTADELLGRIRTDYDYIGVSVAWTGKGDDAGYQAVAGDCSSFSQDSASEALALLWLDLRQKKTARRTDLFHASSTFHVSHTHSAIEPDVTPQSPPSQTNMQADALDHA